MNQLLHSTLSVATAALLASLATAQNIGTPFCPSNPNSTGSSSMASATGSNVVASNNVMLSCTGLPNSVLGLFIVSRSATGSSMPAGSSGNLCLTAPIGAYTSNVLATGASGQVTMPVNLTSVPAPGGPFAVQAGETLRFQFWHRDTTAASTPTSNFSMGVEIQFAPPPPSFANDVFPLFTQPGSVNGLACTQCHGAVNPQGGLNIATAPVAFMNLFNVASTMGGTCSGMIRVVPNNPTASLLFNKITASPPSCGSAMPLGGGGNPNIVRDWILAGAPNN